MMHIRGTFTPLLALLCACTRAPHETSSSTVTRKIPAPTLAVDAGARPDRSGKEIAAATSKAKEIAEEVASARGIVLDDPPEHATADYRDPAALAKAGLSALGSVALLPVLSREEGDGVVDVSPCVPTGEDVLGIPPGASMFHEARVLDESIRLHFTPAQKAAVDRIDPASTIHVFDDLGGSATFCAWVRFAVTAPGGRAGRLLQIY